MYRSTARPPVFFAETERPHHHQVELFNNYAKHDLDHLILRIAQRTTRGGQSIRLGQHNLVGMWRWISNVVVHGLDALGVEQCHVQAVLVGTHVDAVTLSPWTDERGRAGGILITIVRRADAGDTSTARAVLDWTAAGVLRDALDQWIESWALPVVPPTQGG